MVSIIVGAVLLRDLATFNLEVYASTLEYVTNNETDSS